MIQFRNIRLQVSGQTLFANATLQIAKGDKVVLHGPSGSGKSSLLKCAVGAVPLAEGSVQVDGMELSASTVASIRSRIAYIGQEPVLGAERVRDAILLPFSFKAHRGNRPTDKQLMELLERLRLPSALLDQPCNRVSGGEKQRIAVARAILLGKTIFLADEVSSALDPESRAAVMTEIFRPETTVLSVSHDDEWIDGCNRSIQIDRGQLLEETP